MPQDIEFNVPFQVRVNPDEEAARDRNLAWARIHGLVDDEESARRYLSWDIAGLMARWVPAAGPPELDLTIDAVIVATVLDDQVDVGTSPDLVERICSPLFDVMHRGANSAALRVPLVTAFTDVWRRLIDGMPEGWKERTREGWARYFNAYAEESRYRAKVGPPMRAEHFALRRKSGFVSPMLDLTERALACPLPERVRATPELDAFLTITADVVDTLNDVHSLEKEELRGDCHNLVLVVEHERGCSRREALCEVRDEIHSWLNQFVMLASEFPQLYESLRLTTNERSRTDRMVAGMQHAMSGYYDWSRRTRRYAPENLIPADRPAYPDVASPRSR
jgi:hypothetical protein